MKQISRSILFCFVFTGLFVALSISKNLFEAGSERLAHGLLGTLAGLIATAIFLKIDRKRFKDIGLTFERETLVRFVIGILIGIILMGLLACSVIYFTGVSVSANPQINWMHFIMMAIPLIPLAFMEELGFRAYPLENIKTKYGVRVALLITSVLFALYHVANGWTITSSFMGPAIWGLVFGLAAIYSKGIAMPTGIHFAANLTTSAFGQDNNAAKIWILEQPVSAPITTMIDWAVVLPALALLIFAVVCIEIYMRNQKRFDEAR